MIESTVEVVRIPADQDLQGETIRDIREDHPTHQKVQDQVAGEKIEEVAEEVEAEVDLKIIESHSEGFEY